MNENAVTYAQQQADLLRNQLADLYENLTTSKESQIAQADANKQALLNTIDTQIGQTQSQFEEDAQSAYVNKVLSGGTVSDELSRMGLTSSGFGLDAYKDIETAYSSNLGELQRDRNLELENLETEQLNVEQSYLSDVAGIESDYAQDKLSLDKYIGETSRDVYDEAYNRYIDEVQRKYDNYITARSYESGSSSTKNYSNQVAPYQLGVTGVKTGTGKVKYTMQNGDTYTFAEGINPWTGGDYHSDAKTSGVYDPSKVFSNGYQPNNINGSKLKKYDSGAVTVNGNQQSVWTTNGKYYVWDGLSNDYIQVKKSGGNWVS